MAWLFDLLWELRIIGYCWPAYSDQQEWEIHAKAWGIPDHRMADRRVLGIPEWLKLTR